MNHKENNVIRKCSGGLAKALTLFTLLVLTACTGLPKGIEPIDSFDVERYLGTWYEIARLDHRFERGLSNVSATYRLKEDGTLEVINRGFKEDEQNVSEAVGRAKFARGVKEGYLKVSFFGPFFGSYVVFDLDKDYSRAYVTGNSRSYLWFLSRSRQVSEVQKDRFIQRATALGFDLDELIWVDQSREPQP